MNPARLLLRLRPCAALAALAALTVFSPALLAQGTTASAVDRGRYLVKIGGCNDCHTAGYTQNEGKVPEKDWLQGDALGWQGPWGTTYATNLRLHFAGLTEAQWLQQARTMRSRPPMPWFVLREMTDADLKAVYAYMRQAGPAGRPAPAALAPGVAATGPVVRFPG
ncbi:MAG: c-type cytochrome [Rubrivivax sp.]|jgi:mono/diheme cytochrome c family protein